MKNTHFSFVLALVLGMSLAFSACKKEDTVAPTITLKGDNPATVMLGESYTDPGATAQDDVDGDLTSEIKVSGTVNTNAIGTYMITYEVADAAGNVASAVRTITVTVGRDAYLGTYSTSENCPSPYGLSSAPTITAGTAANEIVLSLFYFNGGNLTMTVDGTNVTVAPNQSPGPWGDNVSGTGTFDGSAITMNMTFTPSQGAVVNCVVTWTK